VIWHEASRLPTRLSSQAYLNRSWSRERSLELPALAAEIEKHGRRVRLLADADAIVQATAPDMRNGDIVAILSNGGFGGIYEKLPSKLRTLAGETNSANAAGKG